MNEDIDSKELDGPLGLQPPNPGPCPYRDLELEEVPYAAAAPLAARAIRFCNVCGSSWNPDWIECSVCTARGVPHEPGTASQAFSSELRSIKASVALYFALLSISIVAMVVLMATKEPFGAVGDLTLSAIFAAVVFAWCLSQPRTIASLLTRRFSPIWLVVAPLLALPTFAIASGIVRGLEHVFHVPSLSYSSAYTAEGYSFAWVILAICVEPGVFEELAFRGVIQTALQRTLSPIEALFTTALMFGILHLSIPSMPHLFLIGVTLGWLRLKTGSLLPGMIMHFTHNLLVILSEHSGSIWPW